MLTNNLQHRLISTYQRKNAMLAVRNALKGIQRQVVVEVQDKYSILWGALEWFSAFETLFCSEGCHQLGGSQDNPLYYVWRETAETVQPLCYSKRLTHQFAPGGQYFELIDWKQSVLLNMVVRSAYYLVVAVCSKESSRAWIAKGCQGQIPNADVQHVIHPVFARPLANTLRPSKEHKISCAYPNITFVLHDMDYSTQSMLLDEEGQSYCVALMAYPVQVPKRFLKHVGVGDMPISGGSQELYDLMCVKKRAQQIEQQHQSREDMEEFQSAESHASTQSVQFLQPNKSQVVKLFRGYVAFPQLNMAMQHGQTDRQLQKTVTKKIRMHASDSQGLAEVYVSTAKPIGKQYDKKKRGGIFQKRQSSKLCSTLDQESHKQPQITFNCNLHMMQLPLQELVIQLLDNMD
eukprot:TRINITY_DN4639_c0_g1_i4.p1 TRINITY_DN4639_c0_g1~~TRINITY_DN4639_c0_g1_i4.p1  ORF type:complete len:405 (+),score=37.95 TRINITY_DN4639_c0_g1_i4:2018-3232(+)